MPRILNVLWALVNTAESVAFVLAASLGLLALAWGKTGLKRWKLKQEAACWRAVGYLVLVKLACMALTLPVSLYQFFKR
jgi:hypothetical protein